MVYAIFTGTGITAGGIVAVNVSTDAVTGEVPLSGTLAPGVACVNSLIPSTHMLWAAYTPPEDGVWKNGSAIGVNVLTGSVVENISVGFAAVYAAVNPSTDMVYVDGCSEIPIVNVCDSQQLAIINGTAGSLVTTVSLDDGSVLPTMTVDPETDIVYFTGASQLVAVNGTNGSVTFKVYSQICGRHSIGDIPSTDQVVMALSNYTNYLMVYNGANGTLVNMYFFPSSNFLSFQAYDAKTGELDVSDGADLLALYEVQATGNVNATLIDVGCGVP